MKESLHRRSFSSLNDLEKSIDSPSIEGNYEGNHQEHDHQNRNRRYNITVIILSILLIGTIINFMVFTRPEAMHLATISQQDAGVNKFLNVDNINLKDVELNEFWKITHPCEVPRPEPVPIPKATKEKEQQKEEQDDEYDDEKSYANDKKTQRKIVEMLSINSIVILTNGRNVIQEQKVRDIFTSLNLTPEVQFVQLNLHPNYAKIMKYLRDYNLRAYQYEFIASYTQTSYEIDDLDIPRLFIGGLPIANFDDIIKKNANNELQGFLRTYGQGLIKLGV